MVSLSGDIICRNKNLIKRYALDAVIRNLCLSRKAQQASQGYYDMFNWFQIFFEGGFNLQS